jgi:hypothetical protein
MTGPYITFTGIQLPGLQQNLLPSDREPENPEPPRQFYRLGIEGAWDLDDLVGAPGLAVTRRITVTNQGLLTTTVLLRATVYSDWYDVSSMPASVTLAPNASLAFPITLTLPMRRDLPMPRAA